MIIRLLMILFSVSFVLTSTADAKRSRRTKVKKKGVKVVKVVHKTKVKKGRKAINPLVTKRNSKKTDLTFNAPWYYSLSPQSQKIYLRTIKKIMVRAAGGKTAMNSPLFWQYLIEKADASARVNIRNGRAYGSDYSNFVSNLTMDFQTGPPNNQTINLARNCPSAEQTCSIFTCLQTGADGYPQLCCMNNDTPACSRAGDATRDLLHATLRNCRGNTNSQCTVINNLLTAETANLSTACSGKTEAFCALAIRDMNSALAARGDATPPVRGNPPTGGNCEEIMNEAQRRHEARAAAAGANLATTGGGFWQEVSATALRVCNPAASRELMQAVTARIGVCRIGDMAAPGAVTETERVNTQRRSDLGATGSDSANRPYEQCIAARLAPINERITRDVGRLYAAIGSRFTNPNFDPPQQEVTQSNVETLRGLIEAGGDEDRIRIEADLRSRSRCSYDRETERGVAGTSAAPSSYPGWNAILGKIQAQNWSQITQGERRQFQSVFGLQPERFRQTFCSSADDFQDAFQAAINGGYSMPHAGTPAHRALDANGEAAFDKMRACQENWVSGGEASCGPTTVSRTGLGRVSEESPIVARTKTEPRQCFLVYDYESTEVTGAAVRNTATNEWETPTRNVYALHLDNLSGDTVPPEEMNFEEFSQRYELYGYACEGDAEAGIVTPGHESEPMINDLPATF